MEALYTIIGNHLIVTNPKLATSFIQGQGGKRFKGVSFSKREGMRTFLKDLKTVDKVIFIIKEPYKKFISGLVTVFITGFFSYPRMIRKFEESKGYRYGYTQTMIKKYQSNVDMFMDEGYQFQDEIGEADRDYLLDLIIFIMDRGITDSNILADAHLRPHHQSVSLLFSEVINNTDFPKENIFYLDITSRNNILYKFIKDHIPKYRLKHMINEGVDVVSSESWKDIVGSAWQRMSDNPHTYVLSERLTYEFCHYNLIKRSLKVFDKKEYERN